MISLRPLGSTGYDIRTGQPAGTDPYGVDEVLWNGRPIGLCNRMVGAPLAMTAVVSEAIMDEVVELLEERDGRPVDRHIILSVHDPRRVRAHEHSG